METIVDQASKAGRAVPADDIGLSARDWQANVQLKVFLSYLFDIKNTIEHKKNWTGVQNLMFFYDLKENYCHKDERLEVKHLPKSLKLQDRERSVEQMEAEELEDFIRLTNEVMQQELQERCFDNKISDSRQMAL